MQQLPIIRPISINVDYVVVLETMLVVLVNIFKHPMKPIRSKHPNNLIHVFGVGFVIIMENMRRMITYAVDVMHVVGIVVVIVQKMVDGEDRQSSP